MMMKYICLFLFIVLTIEANDIKNYLEDEADVNIYMKTPINYFEEAGEYYDINPKLLHAIAETESGKNPNAVNCANRNGSCDYGLMQINSIHLSMLQKHGIYKNDLFNPRINIFVGAWVLKNCMNKHGNSYKTLNCYNGKIKNNPYYAKVLKNYYTTSSKNESTQTVSVGTGKFKILLLGDSMAQGLYPQFKSLLKQYDVAVVSKYKVGSSSKYWANQNISKIIEDEKPNYIFVALGTNEYQNPYFQHTDKIINDIKQSGVSFKWIAPIQQKAKDYNSYVSSIIGKENMFETNEDLPLYDGVHPTQKSFKKLGYMVLADSFQKL